MSIAVCLAGFGCVFLIVIFVLINKYSRRNKFGIKGMTRVFFCIILKGSYDAILMNEWMMHLYSALFCIVVHPKHFTVMWGGLYSTTTSVQHPLGWLLFGVFGVTEYVGML